MLLKRTSASSNPPASSVASGRRSPAARRLVKVRGDVLALPHDDVEGELIDLDRHGGVGDQPGIAMHGDAAPAHDADFPGAVIALLGVVNAAIDGVAGAGVAHFAPTEEGHQDMA